MPKISMQDKLKIERILGRKLVAERIRAGYEKFSESDISELRHIAKGSATDAILYIYYLLNGDTKMGDAKNFLDCVVLGNQDLTEWVKERKLLRGK